MLQADPPAFCPFPKGQAAVHTLLLSHTDARLWQVTAGKSLSHACLTSANSSLQNDLSPGNSSEQCLAQVGQDFAPWHFSIEHTVGREIRAGTDPPCQSCQFEMSPQDTVMLSPFCPRGKGTSGGNLRSLAGQLKAGMRTGPFVTNASLWHFCSLWKWLSPAGLIPHNPSKCPDELPGSDASDGDALRKC